MTTRYSYDGNRVIEEQDVAGNAVATYVYGHYVDDVLSMRRDVDGDTTPEDYYFHADGSANVLALTDASGNVVERYAYGDFGRRRVFDGAGAPLPASTVRNPYAFVGRRYDDETGLYYLRARYLDPRAGRFLSRDPLGAWADSANLGNSFTYAGNNPWSGTDPHGLYSINFKECSSGEIDQLYDALDISEDHVFEAYSRFGRDSDYVLYFDGDDRDSRYRTVQDQMTNMRKIYYQENLDIKCSNTAKVSSDGSTIFARVWVGDGNHIKLFLDYWNVYPSTGVFGQELGVLILTHELAHEAGARKDTVICSNAAGIEGKCWDLAANDPGTAKNNADNYNVYVEHFFRAENWDFQLGGSGSSGGSSSGGGQSECEECMSEATDMLSGARCSTICFDVEAVFVDGRTRLRPTATADIDGPKTVDSEISDWIYP